MINTKQSISVRAIEIAFPQRMTREAKREMELVDNFLAYGK